MKTVKTFSLKQKRTIKNFENLVKEIFSSENENLRNELSKKMENIMKTCKKRPSKKSTKLPNKNESKTTITCRKRSLELSNDADSSIHCHIKPF